MDGPVEDHSTKTTVRLIGTESVLPLRDCILVLGMHRSGTSALTRVLSLMGAALPRELMGAGLGNETGHWESSRLVEYHDQLLAEIGSAWDDWRALDLSRLTAKRRQEISTEIAAIIEAEYGDAPLIVIKDPRISRFVNLFLEALTEARARTYVVHIYRNPLEVIGSLSARAALWQADRTPVYGALLWLAHTLKAESATRNLPRTFVSYDALLADWRSAMERLVGGLGADWPHTLDEIADTAQRYLTPTQRHFNQSAEDLLLDPALRDWAGEAYQAFEILQSNPASMAAMSTLDRIRSELDHAAPLLDRLIRDAVAAVDLAREEAETQKEELRSEVEHVRSQLGEAITAREAVQADAETQKEELRSEIELVRNQLGETITAREAVQADAETQKEQLRSEIELVRRQLGETITAREAVQADAETQKEQLRSEIELVRRQLGETITAREAVQADAETQKEQLRSEIELVRRQLGEAITAREAVQADAETQKEQLKSEIELVRRQLGEAITAREAVHAEAEAREEKLRSEIELVRSQSRDTAAALKAARAETELLEAELESEVVLRAAAEAQVANLAAELETSNTRLDAMTVARNVAQANTELRGAEWSATAAVIAAQAASERNGMMAQLAHNETALAEHMRQLQEAQTAVTQALEEKETTLRERDLQTSALRDETERQRHRAVRLNASLQVAQKQIDDLISSRSMRVTLPFRQAKLLATRPLWQSKRYLRAIARQIRSAYFRVPLNPATRDAHRALLMRFAPSILRRTKIPIVQPIKWRAYKTEPPEPLLQIDGMSAIKHDTADQPLVSVIVPAYGQYEYTLQCLNSIALNPPSSAYEIIVVDDCSPDDSTRKLKEIDGIRLVCNAENLGFIRSCNAGAEASKGDYLCFLNNDTVVMSGWLDELLRTFDEFPGTGLAGSKLINPDGSLQEAGGIIWRDGSAWNFGRGKDPDEPGYSYAREVDYCSGAAIMLPKALFRELGGFDEHYLPAYCEDSDLALKVRARGYRVIYQPMSIVTHFEGITSGTDVTTGTKAYQLDNSRKLFERWRDQLLQHQEPGKDIERAKDRMATRRVLVLDHCTPTPDQDAGSVTALNNMLLLREMGFQVTFVPEDNFMFMPDYTLALQRAGIEVLYAPYVRSVSEHLKDFGHRYDLILMFRALVVDRNLSCARKHCPNAKVLFHTSDLHFLRMSREAELADDDAKRKAAEDFKRIEFAALSNVDASIVHSTHEAALLQQELPEAEIHVSPIITHIRSTDVPFAERRDIAFVGGYRHLPNVDAVLYFVEEVMPIVRQQLPGAKFYVIGSNAPEEVLALASDDVIIAGYVEDLPSLLDQIRVIVAPLRYGSGIKGKIGTAMALGVPNVCTTLAAEGMSLTDGDNVLIADGAQKLAAAVEQLYNDGALWGHLSRNGLAFAREHWGPEAAWANLNRILTSMGLGRASKGQHRIKLYEPKSELPANPDVGPRGRTSLGAVEPVASVTSKAEFGRALRRDVFQEIRKVEQEILQCVNCECFDVEGFCVACDRLVQLKVDMQSGGYQSNGLWHPNWRERLECPSCRMNNRQRLVAGRLSSQLTRLSVRNEACTIYMMEQTTPIYHWASGRLSKHRVIGSEYLGPDIAGGADVGNIRHEDVTKLSFEDASIDVIVSTDVFEHVPEPQAAFAECARVLRPGGAMLATFPFYVDKDKSSPRAILKEGVIEHTAPPEYHGNPISDKGSLVFTDFGWDVLDLIKNGGFQEAAIEVYGSLEYGHFGAPLIIFAATK